MSTTSPALLKILNFKRLNSAKNCMTIKLRELSKYYKKVNPLPTKYGGKNNITVLPGIGIGPEIMKSTLEVLKAVEAPLSYEIMEISEDREDEDFEQVLASIRRNKIVIKANIETKSRDPSTPSRNINLRKLLDLYVYVLPCKSFPGLQSKYPPVDVVLIRQNTEGEYLMLEHEPIPGSVESLKVVSRYNSERLAEYAYKYAAENKRKKITILHTADVFQLSEGIFVQAALKVSKKYPEIVTNVMEAGYMIIDLMRTPKNYDVILATNLNGSMIGNFINGMLGGPSLSSGVNLSENGIAVFEPGVRNKGSSIVNMNIANPTAMLLAACNLLNYLGHTKKSEVVRNAIYKSLVVDRVLSRDLGGNATTEQITQNIIRHVQKTISPLQAEGKRSVVKHPRFQVPRPAADPTPDSVPPPTPCNPVSNKK